MSTAKEHGDKNGADELLREAAKSIRQLTFGDTEEQGWWVPEQRRANKVRERIEEFLNAYTPSHVGQKGNYDPNESPEAKAVRLAKVAKFVAACQLGDAVGIREQIFAPPEWFGLTETPLADVLREHHLAHITCDHDTKQDNPVCACSKINLGWHSSVGQAVEAWLAHVMVEIKTRCAASATACSAEQHFIAPRPLPEGLVAVLTHYDAIIADAPAVDPEWDFVMTAIDWREVRSFFAKLKPGGAPTVIEHPPRPA